MLASERHGTNGSSEGISELQVQSPFHNALDFAREGMDLLEQRETPPPTTLIESPFRSVYQLEEPGGVSDLDSEAYAEFLAELEDREFDEAVFELANEAADLHESRGEGEVGRGTSHEMQAERLLRQHFAPLEGAAHTFFEAVAEKADQTDLAALSDTELDRLLEAYAPRTAQLSPAFEHFFGRLIKKVGKVVKKGAALAKKGVKAVANLGLSAILRKLHALVRPLIQRVIQTALNKLPEPLRPHAQKLAAKFLSEVAYESPGADGASVDDGITQIQQEFDLQISNLLFADDELEQDLALSEFQMEVDQPTADPVGELEQARARFINELRQLKDGEDPTPVVEQFIPAILPALKLGIKLAGRERIVKFLARLVAKLIQRLVGPQYTPPLSRAIVDAGLRLINLEATPEEADGVAGEAVAATVEETVRRVAALPEYALDNDAVLEGFVLEAFEHAAAANLPPILPDAVYRKRPDLRETSGRASTWVYQPRGRGARKYYQKNTMVFENIVITPHIATTVTTFGGVPLSVFLRDKLGLQAGPGLTARVHLYEAIPGTWLSRISKHEKHVPGLGTSARSAWSQLHPLTPLAAGMLLRQPLLGRELPAGQQADPLRIGTGQRFYYLEVAGARPQTAPGNGRQPALRRSSEVQLELDFPRGQIRAFIFLSETDCQEMTVKLRQQLPVGAVVTALSAMLDTAMRNVFVGGMYRQVKVIHKVAMLWPESGSALKRLPPVVQEKLREKLSEWLGRSLSEYLQQQPQRAQGFIAATEDLADGVTLAVTFSNVAGLAPISRILLGQSVNLQGSWFPDELPEVHIQTVPGFKNG